MKRSAGVTVVAVLSLIGSLFTLLMGIFMALIPFVIPGEDGAKSPFPPGFMKMMMIGAALMYVLPAIWGILTSIGLFRLKEWARISIIIFSVLLILMSGFGALIAIIVPIPPPPNQNVDPGVTTGIRIFMTVFAAALVSIGLWWLVFFTRAKVKEQFTPTSAAALLAPPSPQVFQATPSPSPTIPVSVTAKGPLSLTILAWFMLAGSLLILISLVLQPPAMFLTKLLTGIPALLYYLTFLAVHLYVGIGLLRLKTTARTVGVAYYAFAFMNAAVFYFAPGGRSRMLDLMHRSLSMYSWMPSLQDQQLALFDNTRFFAVSACSGLALMLVPLYFLITRKTAFEEAATARQLKASNPL